jgi:hypothetical protein
MSWKNIIKENKLNDVIRGLEKEVYKKYKGDEVMRLLDRGVHFGESITLFMRINRRLDKIAEKPTEEDLIDFMTQYLDFNYTSAKRYIDSKK